MQRCRSSLFLFVVLALTFLSPPSWGQEPTPTIGARSVADVDSGATNGELDVTSATAGVRVAGDAVRTGLRVRVKQDAVVAVCFNYVDRTANCATALTDPDDTGYCATAGSTYVFLVHDEHFRGQVCAILREAGTATVGWNHW